MTPNVNLMGSFYTPNSKKWSFYSSADCNNDYLKYVDKGGQGGRMPRLPRLRREPREVERRVLRRRIIDRPGEIRDQEGTEVHQVVRVGLRRQLRGGLRQIQDPLVEGRPSPHSEGIPEVPQGQRDGRFQGPVVRRAAREHRQPAHPSVLLRARAREDRRPPTRAAVAPGQDVPGSIESFKVRIEQTLSSGEFALGSERRALMDGLGGALDEKTESDRKAKKAL
jgi:hypothetical protein